MKPFRRRVATLVSIFLLGALGLPAFAATQAFALDPTHTQVRITWNHAGFSHPGATFDVAEGSLIWDAENPGRSSVTVTIPVDSVDTRVPALDHTFKTQYFDAAKYPAITFASTAVERVGSNRYRVKGNLTVRGVTQPVTLEATLNGAGEHPLLHAPAIGFDATATIKRSGFGLDAYIPLVGDEVQIRMTAEAVDPAALAKAGREE